MPTKSAVDLATETARVATTRTRPLEKQADTSGDAPAVDTTRREAQVDAIMEHRKSELTKLLSASLSWPIMSYKDSTGRTVSRTDQVDLMLGVHAAKGQLFLEDDKKNGIILGHPLRLIQRVLSAKISNRVLLQLHTKKKHSDIRCMECIFANEDDLKTFLVTVLPFCKRVEQSASQKMLDDIMKAMERNVIRKTTTRQRRNERLAAAVRVAAVAAQTQAGSSTGSTVKSESY